MRFLSLILCLAFTSLVEANGPAFRAPLFQRRQNVVQQNFFVAPQRQDFFVAPQRQDFFVAPQRQNFFVAPQNFYVAPQRFIAPDCYVQPAPFVSDCVEPFRSRSIYGY